MRCQFLFPQIWHGDNLLWWRCKKCQTTATGVKSIASKASFFSIVSVINTVVLTLFANFVGYLMHPWRLICYYIVNSYLQDFYYLFIYLFFYRAHMWSVIEVKSCGFIGLVICVLKF